MLHRPIGIPPLLPVFPHREVLLLLVCWTHCWVRLKSRKCMIRGKGLSAVEPLGVCTVRSERDTGGSAAL